ncbi:MAG: RdgB/HAM1 family non-canonical purine NTP pyrophosphatase [Litorivicinaceae bacterium]|jgi:XTP/dITP diphosphohydrolase|nr:RdgB/HAM1 family non-canonical purine NTP pyrophosphatase [Litorivicinaceae bacterium]MDP5329028.1 RdgB/HAM1 family non-canonical purine NTP pyrophosphatase [Litorivicinaceae bacterium]MDP5330804.1 RdgB/HAM1 family non-canonical purine NTP pyrophosphatase [Litorivicinaceae bacterium]MDP5341132.1 RdgB/HAM1 family non-canonical purine NTP pyrophosphatase [Litorivicinaceae bacterium]MDP5342327.1 RdgB/HAM1 family non-canonical purine NTP pyrophosphatase [Litorivicinaceae bacterium]
MSTETQRVVLATSNPGKVREFQILLAPMGLEIISQSDLGVSSPEETGLTFIENALIKARHAARMTGLPAIADDSGLVVPALNGMPGLYSARYAGLNASDGENVVRLLNDMAMLSDHDRIGYYLCAMTLITQPTDPAPVIAQAGWPGRIGFEPKGTGGFGYDPIFIPEGSDRTAAEMDPDVKNAQSHRALATAALIQQLS